jgi:uncharacterized membrane protein YphA (DoxX/SURF4 family)
MTNKTDALIKLTRLSIGIMFLWFGFLKLFTSGDGLQLLQNSLPAQLAFSQVFSFIVAFFEITIGLSFITNKLVKVSSVAAFVYLILTSFFILITFGFEPRFPVLSTSGESSIKNIALALATLILFNENKSHNLPTSESNKSIE